MATQPESKSKSEIRAMWARAREAKMWAAEFVAKAADSASEDDCIGFAGAMQEANRLTLVAAKYIKEARAAQVQA